MQNLLLFMRPMIAEFGRLEAFRQPVQAPPAGTDLFVFPGREQGESLTFFD